MVDSSFSGIKDLAEISMGLPSTLCRVWECDFRLRFCVLWCTLLPVGVHLTTLVTSKHQLQPRRAGHASVLPTAWRWTFLGRVRGDRAFSFAGPHAWNSLPVDIRCSPSLNTFKKRLKAHFAHFFLSLSVAYNSWQLYLHYYNFLIIFFYNFIILWCFFIILL